MQRLFGTDGVRGVANTEPMTAEMALAIGRAIAYICRRDERRHRIVIGKDTRLSGYMIENALTAGICSMGVDVLLVGPLPTPGIAFTTISMRADAGIVISASHNPYQDNGIKIFSRDGYKLSYALEDQIEDLIETGHINNIRPTAEHVGKAHRIDDAIGRYIVFCKNTLPSQATLEGMKIVLDCANGATYKVAPIIFSELGASVDAIHNTPNGVNINDNCGSQFPENLVAEVLRQKADVGLAFDGDGDRLIAVDETGKVLTGDHMLAVCGSVMRQLGELTNDLVVLTPMSNLGLRLAFDKMGIRYEDADVGDRNVLELMQKNGAVLGGEQSGHIVMTDYGTTGDGLISALQFLAAMVETGKPASELAKVFEPVPQLLQNVRYKNGADPLAQSSVISAISDGESRLAANGRLLIRKSGTEPLVRVMGECEDEALLKAVIADICTEVEKFA